MRTSPIRAISALALVALGAWGGLVPFIGSYFNWVYGSDKTWDWTAGRFWLSVLPAAVAIVGGLLLLAPSVSRATVALGRMLAIAAGAWFVVGPEISRLWNHGVSQTGRPMGATTQQVFEQLTYFSALGIAILVVGALAETAGVGRSRSAATVPAGPGGVASGPPVATTRRSGLRRRRRGGQPSRVEHE